MLLQVAVLCLSLSLSAIMAETPSDGQFVRVLQVHVKPGMTAQYEAARRDIIAHLATHKFSYPFSVSRGENLVYRNITRLENWAGLDKRSAAAGEFEPPNKGFAERNEGFANSYQGLLFVSRPPVVLTIQPQKKLSLPAFRAQITSLKKQTPISSQTAPRVLSWS